MTAATPNSPQLTPDNLRELQAAKQSLKKIRRAVSAARFEGYTVAICGGMTVVFSGGNIWSMIGGALLTAVGIIEIVGAGRLAKLDVLAVRMLTINQLCLAGLILLYAVWSLYGEVTHPASDLSDLSAADAQAINQVDSSITGLMHEVMLLMYGSLIIAAGVEAGMAAYYHSRGAYLKRYLADTPGWIVAMQKNGVSV